MSSRIWLSSPHMSGNELRYIHEAFETNWVAPLGPNVNEFEKDLERVLDVQGVAALNSGTSAIHLALIILGVKMGDEVICSTFTFSASANPILYLGATPVFIDSEQETWNMDPELLEKAIKGRIKNGKKPKAIILVHLYGMPAQVDRITDISEKYEIPIIEDAAEALGSQYNGKPCGSFGIIGILSFNGNKIITTSGGGALVSNRIEYIEKAKFLATQARDKADHYQHSEVGYNYRMSNIIAGIGRGQLEVLENRISLRRENNEFYRLMLQNYDFVSFQNELKGHFSNYWLTAILITRNTKKMTTLKLRIALEKLNIETRPLWKPMHLQPIFHNFPSYINGISEKLFDIGLCLPSGSNLTDENKDRINTSLRNLLSK